MVSSARKASPTSGKSKNPTSDALKRRPETPNSAPTAKTSSAEISKSGEEPSKRTVVTSSVFEAAAKGAGSEAPSTVAQAGAAKVPETSKPEASKPEAVAKDASEAKPDAAVEVSQPSTPEKVEKPTVISSTGSQATAPQTGTSQPTTRQAKPKAPSKMAAKPASPKASGAAAEKATTKSTVAKKAVAAEKSPPQAKKAAAVTPKAKSTAPGKPTVKSAAKSASPSRGNQTSPKGAAAPAKAGDTALSAPADKASAASAAPAKPFEQAFGGGPFLPDEKVVTALFGMWKSPEVNAMVEASSEAFEGGMSVASDAFSKVFETMNDQADVFSDAGSRVVAQYEELFESQRKGFEEVWESSSALIEKSGGFGVEIVDWAQREFEESQKDFEALSKAENLSEIQELNARIFNRCIERNLSEGEKMQEMMFAAFNDCLAAVNKMSGSAWK